MPADGARKVARMRSVVVLPAPFEPMKPNRSPLLTVRSSLIQGGDAAVQARQAEGLDGGDGGCVHNMV